MRYQQRRRTPAITSNYIDYFLGVDVGQRVDPSTICVIAESIWDYEKNEWVAPNTLTPDNRARMRNLNHSSYMRFRPPDSKLYLTTLERLPLRTPYPDVADRVTSVAHSLVGNGNVSVVLDNTGVGAGVKDMLRERDIWPVVVNITGGESPKYREDGSYTVPRNYLIHKLDAAFQSGRLKVNPNLPLLDAFEDELESFEEIRSETTGALSYRQTRSSKVGHADLVLAASLALFYRNRYYSEVDQQAWDYWRMRQHADPEDIDIIANLTNCPEAEYGGSYYW